MRHYLLYHISKLIIIYLGLNESLFIHQNKWLCFVNIHPRIMRTYTRAGFELYDWFHTRNKNFISRKPRLPHTSTNALSMIPLHLMKMEMVIEHHIIQIISLQASLCVVNGTIQRREMSKFRLEKSTVLTTDR